MADAILPRVGIYKITNKINGKIYIGSSVNLKNRWQIHCSDLRRNKHHSKRLQLAWNKYGAEAFEFTVIEVVLDKSALIAREQAWIDLLRPTGRGGYNVSPTAGNCLGVKHTEETRRKVALANTGRRPSEETRKKLSAAQRGKVISPEQIAKYHETMRARTPEQRAATKAKAAATKRAMTAEARARISEAMSSARRGSIMSDAFRDMVSARFKGKKQTPEQIAKRASAHVGAKRSEETRAKISAKAKARPKRYGQVFTAETKAKMSATQKARNAAKRAAMEAQASVGQIGLFDEVRA